MIENPQHPVDMLPAADSGIGEIGSHQRAAHTIPFSQRPTCTIKEACNAAGLGRTKLYEIIKSGELKITPVGRRRLVQVPSLLKFLRVDGA